MAKKKVVKKTKKVTEEKTSLSRVDILEIEIQELKVNLIKREIQIGKLVQERDRALKDTDYYKTQLQINGIQQSLSTEIERKSKIKKEIEKRYNIKTPKWGYDSETGEIEVGNDN